MKKLLLAIYLLLPLYVVAQTGIFLPSDRFSSSLISTIVQDKQGFIWVGTDYGLNRYDGYRFVTFLHDDTDSTSLSVNVIVSLFADSKGRLWVGTNRGLDRYDYATGRFRHFSFPQRYNPRVSSILQRKDGTILVGTAGYGAFRVTDDDRIEPFEVSESDNYFSRFFEDSKGRLWKGGFDETVLMADGKKAYKMRSVYGTPQDFIQYGKDVLVVCQHGLLKYADGKLEPFVMSMEALDGKDAVLSQASAGPDGSLYVGTRGQGVYKVVKNGTTRLEPLSVNAYGVDSRTVKVNSLLFDSDGNLWIGCHRKGLLMVPQRPLQFTSWSFDGQGMHLGSSVSSVCEGDDGITWCTVQGVGIYGFNKQGKIVAHPQSPKAPEFIFRNGNTYWVGTDGALYAYNPLTGQATLAFSYDCDRFNDMTIGSDGNLYVSVFSRGFCIYNPATGELRNHNFSEQDNGRGRLCNNWIMSLSKDRHGLIWMGTSSGVSCYNPRNDSFNSEGWNVILDGVVCFEVCELHSGKLPTGQKLDGAIAIGTEQGLYLYDRKSHTVEPFPGSEVLSNKVVSYIIQANDGDIWCSTSAGIWQYSLKQHKFIGHVAGNGLTQREYLYGVGMHTDDDKVYFGQNDGLTVFSPSTVKKQTAVVDSLTLVGFTAGGVRVSAGTVLNDVLVTDRAIDKTERFRLSYLDHTVTMAFSQLNYDDPANVIYEYRVNNGNWTANPEGVNGITMSQLQPGTYFVEVRALQGNQYSAIKSLTVVISPPWYRSSLAQVIYVILAVWLLALMAMFLRRRTLRQMDEEKMKFLINATHDIRSPLTLIMSPLAKLKNVKLDDLKSIDDFQSFKASVLKPSIDTIDRNANRILDLVNQILDVRKIDKQQMHLHCQKTDIIAFTRGICKMYEYNAKEHNLSFQLDCGDLEQLNVWIDRNQFDKVISNLLSNAFKYTGENGQVTLSITSTSKNAQLQVTDSGIGLDEDTMRHIFDRFYQGNNSRRLNIKGTGIGLNLCKMIVDMHHGTIEAHNRVDGERGSVFTVTLPLGNQHLTAEEMEQNIEPSSAPVAPIQAAAQPVAGTKRYRVLIVDDDEEIGQYISNELSRYYKFTVCHNGREGLKELLSSIDNARYDLVVSDVMMPEMDGFTMLRMIKSNANVSDIPVIMLTSKADVNNRLEGLERGADAFLAKPFNMEELRMNIDNLLRSRQRLKGKYSGAQQQADKVEQPEVKGNDELLMERIMKAINKNLSDSDFNVDMLTQEVGISRAQLHRKMKEMTGISTSEFLRNIRLEQAARLLKEQKINVTQVAYTVGFSNLAHFSTVFRKHFGISPSEYAEREE